MKNDFLSSYDLKKKEIKERLEDFKNKNEQEQFNEFMFCLLTPQSNAQRCWGAVLEIKKLKEVNFENVLEILKTRTRFHNTKTKRILEGKEKWVEVVEKLDSKLIVELRNWLADNVNGYGLKESGHFLRNIGKSNNQIAILDRHILKNLKESGVIDEEKIKNRKDYFDKEKKFLEFSKNLGIPADELDLLLWSKENGEIFK
ncbi:MAG: DNA lyase [Nanoarchaeota archaeon]